MTKEEEEHHQKGVMNTYNWFVNTVSENRNLSVEKVKGTEADVFYAKDSVGFLVDDLKTLEEVRDGIL